MKCRVKRYTARKMYRSGYTIYLIACKVRLDNAWIKPVPINISDKDLDVGDTFDRRINNFEYYNCNAELGYYSHYYVTEEDLKDYESKGGNV